MSKYIIQILNESKRLIKICDASNWTQEEIDECETKAINNDRTQIVIEDSNLYENVKQVYEQNVIDTYNIIRIEEDPVVKEELEKNGFIKFTIDKSNNTITW